MNTSDLNLLLSMVDDGDEEVFHLIKKKIVSEGAPNLILLEKALDSADTLLRHNRIQALILNLKMNILKENITRWFKSEDKTLLEGWILISSIQGKEISSLKIEKTTEQISLKIWLELNNYQTSFEKIAILNEIFYGHCGFDVSTTEISSPETYFIDKILSTRKGNHYSLNTLYFLIARKLNLPLLPLEIKGKLFLAWNDPILSKEAYGKISPPFLFLIDHNGRIISMKEFHIFLEESTLNWNSVLTLSDNGLIRKIMEKIKYSFSLAGDIEKTAYVDDLINNTEY